MPEFVAAVLNLPWTIAGAVCALLSGPRQLRLRRNPPALIVRVTSFWWITWLKSRKGTRGTVIGNLVLIGPNNLEGDLEHELVHVEQAMRRPLVQPLFYALESFKHGYRNNIYEVEAYDRAKNQYIDKS